MSVTILEITGRENANNLPLPDKNWYFSKRTKSLKTKESVRSTTNMLSVLDLAGDDQKQQFKDEIKMMKKLGQHKNIVNMVACCTNKEPFLLVVEYVPNGDLLNYLRNIRLQVRMTYPQHHNRSTFPLFILDCFSF